MTLRCLWTSKCTPLGEREGDKEGRRGAEKREKSDSQQPISWRLIGSWCEGADVGAIMARMENINHNQV